MSTLMNQLLLPITLSYFLNFYGHNSVNDLSVIDRSMLPPLNLILLKISQLRPLKYANTLTTFVLLTVPYLAYAFKDTRNKAHVVQLYMLLLDPIFHMASAVTRSQFDGVCAALVFLFLQAMKNKNQFFGAVVALVIILANPLVGLILVLCFAGQLTLRQQLVVASSFPLLSIFYYARGVKISTFITEYYMAPKSKLKLLYRFMINSSWTTPASFAIITALSLPTLLKLGASQGIGSESLFKRGYYLFGKVVMLTSLLSGLLVPLALVQAVLIFGLELCDDNMIFIMYSSFIHVAGYLTTLRSAEVYHYLVGAFLIYFGVVGFIVRYLNIQFFKLRQLALYIMVLLPIAVLVFSSLSQFKVLRILEESFTMVWSAVVCVYYEVYFWRVAE